MPADLIVTAVDLPHEQIVYYVFPDAGSELTLHAHSWGHWSAVVNGSAMLIDAEGDVEIFTSESKPIYFEPGVLHGFRALVSGTSLINVVDVTQSGFER